MICICIRQKKYCNNLATRVISFFIVSTSSVGESKNRPTTFFQVFLTPSPRYWWRQNLQSLQKIFFQTCSSYISLGCSLCTDQFLIKHYGFKIQAKSDIMSDTADINVRYNWYNYITLYLICRKKIFFSKHSHIIYHLKVLLSLIVFH